MPDLPVRARNTILAGALGDAWGGPYDGSITPQRALFAGTRALSDDTWLTLATCEAIARYGGGVRADGIADVFLDWYSQKRFRALGSATLNVLRDLAAGAERHASSGMPSATAAGGVALRAAPLAFILDPHDPADQLRLRDIVGITHPGDDALAGAIAMIDAIQTCLGRTGVPPDLPAIVAGRLPHSKVRDRLAQVAQIDVWTSDMVDADAVSRVDEAVPLALVIAARAGETMETALAAAAATGANADTVTALTGQILGAAGHGMPSALVDALPERAEVEQVLLRFVQSVVGAVT
jgi:ADP-ribosyl-[dinitrogen reductase] hydrolase